MGIGNHEHSVVRFRLSEVLKRRVDLAASKPKRLRTRLALLAAAAAEIEEVGYPGLTIENIVRRAGLARGTFYIYFKNRSDVAVAVRRCYNAMLRMHRPRGGASLSAFQAIFRMNLFYVGNYADNSSIMAGNEALMRDRPELAKSRDFQNTRWAGFILRDLFRRLDLVDNRPQDPLANLCVRAVLGMADEFMREIYVYKNGPLGEMTDIYDVAEILSFTWYRAIFGQQPHEGRSFLPAGNPVAPSKDSIAQ